MILAQLGNANCDIVPSIGHVDLVKANISGEAALFDEISGGERHAGDIERLGEVGQHEVGVGHADVRCKSN